VAPVALLRRGDAVLACLLNFLHPMRRKEVRSTMATTDTKLERPAPEQDHTESLALPPKEANSAEFSEFLGAYAKDQLDHQKYI
jgi:hypothetical protein